MRYLAGFVCACALSVLPLVGCGDNNGGGGSGGTAGTGGTGGMSECQNPEDCDDGNDCTGNACADGTCEFTPLADGTVCDESHECTTGMCAGGQCDTTPVQDGTACGQGAGACEAGSCVGTFACTEQGIRDAIDVGGGPHTFDCDSPTTVVTEGEIVIDNDVILDGEGSLSVSGDDEHRAFSVPKGITAGLRGFTVTEGKGTNDGVKPYERAGGILNDGTLTLTDSNVSGNTASIGGGVSNNGTLTLTNSTVFGNTAKGGGGISNSGTLTLTNSTVSGNAANVGTGIDNGGTLTLTNSTVSGNTREGDCGRDPPCGGAIWNVSGTLTMTNSTVTGNAFGGLYNILEETAATVISSTLSNNTGEGSGTLSNILNLQGAALTVRNSLVAGACEIYSAAVSSGHNIESPGNTCGFDQLSDQPDVTAEQLNLGPLADNGGPTMTHALGAGSVAIDKILQADCVDADGQPLTTDQRGVARPQGGACDVGAMEMEVTP